MWGAEIISDQSTVYAGFFTHMDACDERGDGKYGADARKQISKELYGLINPADARKAWWDPENEIISPVVISKRNLSFPTDKLGPEITSGCV